MTSKCMLCWTAITNALAILMLLLVIYRAIIGFNDDIYTSTLSAFTCIRTNLSNTKDK
uniref:Glycoprotein n=1 Tax=Human betaherpesvirus 6A TaxID=32603 RepID=A0A140AK75_9BETA|nr:envelope glycoprotein 24 [Human betaherpesvirus 6A]APO38517.1 envelope glycoprotein 24 [Human betaherpesvirus 6A]APO39026.1 envelope glycoprotein 24 [Human betaherpesvirus 6A]APO39106.1 envelope glycoprotein 24 [Human betaherpesvirus 6A]QCO43363.1 glycoprotein [Human betaherpesvirus 6A]